MSTFLPFDLADAFGGVANERGFTGRLHARRVHVLARHLRWHETVDWPRFSTRIIAEFSQPVDLGLQATNVYPDGRVAVEPQLGPLRVRIAEPHRHQWFVQSPVRWLPVHVPSMYEVTISDSAVVFDLPVETPFAQTVAALRASVDTARNLEAMFRTLPASATLENAIPEWHSRARSLDMQSTDTPLGFRGTLAGRECACYVLSGHGQCRTFATVELREPYDGLLEIRPETQPDEIGCYQGWSAIPGLHLARGLAARSMFPRLANALIGAEVRYAIEQATLVGRLQIDQDRVTVSNEGSRVAWVTLALAELLTLAPLIPARRPALAAG